MPFGYEGIAQGQYSWFHKHIPKYLSFGVVHVMSIFESHSQILVQVIQGRSHMEIDEIVFPRDDFYNLSIVFLFFFFFFFVLIEGQKTLSK